MNWYCVNNKKWLIIVGILFCNATSSQTMMQRFKNLFKKEEEKTFTQKIKAQIETKIDEQAEIIEKVRKDPKKLIIGGALGGALIGFCFKPFSPMLAAGALSVLCGAGQYVGVYDISNIALVKKIMDKVGIESPTLAAVAFSLPVGLILCKNLPIATGLIGAFLAYSYHQKREIE